MSCSCRLNTKEVFFTINKLLSLNLPPPSFTIKVFPFLFVCMRLYNHLHWWVARSVTMFDLSLFYDFWALLLHHQGMSSNGDLKLLPACSSPPFGQFTHLLQYTPIYSALGLGHFFFLALLRCLTGSAMSRNV